MQGLDRRLFDAAAVRAVDRRAIDELGIPGYELMCRAGAASLHHLRLRWPEARRILVLCGPGNNGGDGLVLARLARAEGFDVRVCCPLGVPRRGDAALAAQAFAEGGGQAESGRVDVAFAGIDVVVDALFGIGPARPPPGDLALWIEALNATATPVLALDVPSGIDADSGHAPGAALRADVTVSFIALKRGLFTGAAVDCVGEILLETLDVPRQAFEGVEPYAQLLDADVLKPLAPRTRSAHKGAFGHVLTIGGDHGYGGAVRMCGEAALRAGAGLVSVATRAEHVGALLAARPELMVRDAENLDVLLGAASVLAVGPGLGQGAWGRVRFERALGFAGPRVFDADALNLLGEAPRALGASTIITPHPGEAARLLGCDTAEVQRDRFAALQRLVERYACVVVLKGAGTLVGDGQRTAVCATGNPGMASGGMGDVLTGIVAALLAQGLQPFDAASAGVWLHGVAGDRAARGGQRGLLAGDLIAELRDLVNP
ncbi:MAG TPA: NAD(P)H-hydrate dehydratase [Xanthomonadaceae bacterium]|nr:NAD(P)H-hydrate dehydratase [Xanthomonadaceae bacterium]